MHVSGGKEDIPVRNLTINHEHVSELHPSFDREFTVDTSGLLGRRRASVSHIPRAPYDGKAPELYKPKPSSTLQTRSTSMESKPSLLSRIKKKIFGSSSRDRPHYKNVDGDKAEAS